VPSPRLRPGGDRRILWPCAPGTQSPSQAQSCARSFSGASLDSLSPSSSRWSHAASRWRARPWAIQVRETGASPKASMPFRGAPPLSRSMFRRSVDRYPRATWATRTRASAAWPAPRRRPFAPNAPRLPLVRATVRRSRFPIHARAARSTVGRALTCPLAA
jgi:hypothetical protein